MKHMNQKKYYDLNLQLFAEGEEENDGAGAGGDDQDDDEESDEGGEEEKKYSEKDMEAAIEKRLARERRKWNRQQKEKADSGDKAGKDKEESEDSKARKAAEEKASSLEVKLACYEAGVAKDAVDDVVVLAKAYLEKDENLDLEEAIEKVVKKHPSFKKKAADADEEDKKSGNWGQRQSGKGSKKMSGVEERFYEINPDLRK